MKLGAEKLDDTRREHAGRRHTYRIDEPSHVVIHGDSCEDALLVGDIGIGGVLGCLLFMASAWVESEP